MDSTVGPDVQALDLAGVSAQQEPPKASTEPAPFRDQSEGSSLPPGLAPASASSDLPDSPIASRSTFGSAATGLLTTALVAPVVAAGYVVGAATHLGFNPDPGVKQLSGEPSIADTTTTADDALSDAQPSSASLPGAEVAKGQTGTGMGAGDEATQGGVLDGEGEGPREDAGGEGTWGSSMDAEDLPSVPTQKVALPAAQQVDEAAMQVSFQHSTQASPLPCCMSSHDLGMGNVVGLTVAKDCKISAQPSVHNASVGTTVTSKHVVASHC